MYDLSGQPKKRHQRSGNTLVIESYSLQKKAPQEGWLLRRGVEPC
jgi:hypothetical protein